MARITSMRVFDLRFPTSQSLDGSDAMNPDPDYSAAYAALFEIDPTVARISLSLIPDEARDIMTPSIASEILQRAL